MFVEFVQKLNHRAETFETFILDGKVHVKKFESYFANTVRGKVAFNIRGNALILKQSIVKLTGSFNKQTN